jgi:hypothetical protein
LATASSSPRCWNSLETVIILVTDHGSAIKLMRPECAQGNIYGHERQDIAPASVRPQIGDMLDPATIIARSHRRYCPLDNHRGGHITKLMRCPAELQGRSHRARVRRSKGRGTGRRAPGAAGK